MTKEPLGEQMADRRRWGPREIVPIVLVSLNIGALVWGAATMNASVGQLTTAVTELKTTVIALMKDMSEMKIEYSRELGILQDFKARMERKLQQ